MYVRVAEITSTSDIQFRMLMAFVQNVMLPRHIDNGQLSGEVFHTSDHSCFIVSRFHSREEADRIMGMMSSELEEMKGSNRIKMIEGERIFSLGKVGVSDS